MRRAIYAWQDNVSGMWTEEDPGTGHATQFFMEMPKKKQLVDVLNLAATQIVGYTDNGDPPIVVGFGNWIPLLFQAIHQVDSYDSKANGDGPGPVIAADGQRSKSSGPSGGFKMSVALYLSMLVLTLRFEHKYIEANEVLSILHDLNNKIITPTEALDLLVKLNIK